MNAIEQAKNAGYRYVETIAGNIEIEKFSGDVIEYRDGYLLSGWKLWYDGEMIRYNFRLIK